MEGLELKTKVQGRARSIFFILIFVIGGLVAFTLPRLAIPLLISYVLYLVIAPILPKLMKLGLTKNVSISILFGGLIFFSAYPIVKFVPSIKNEAEKLQYYLPKVEYYLRTNYKTVTEKIKKQTGFEVGDKMLIEGLSHAKNASKSVLLNLPGLLGSFLEWIFIVPLFLFFFLKDGQRIKYAMLELAPNSMFERFYYLSHQFNKQLGDYIFAKFIEASIVGFIITSGLLIIDVRFAFILGMVAAVTNIIPYVGPLIGTIPGIVLASVEYGFGPTFGAITMLYVIGNVIDLAIVFPILVSKIVNLHPIVVVVSVILGSQYLGVIGMIISIPLAAALKLLVTEIYNEIYTVTAR